MSEWHLPQLILPIGGTFITNANAQASPDAFRAGDDGDPSSFAFLVMIGTHRFSPSSGHELSREVEHLPDGTALRANLNQMGELSNGEQKSSKQALVRYFRRKHRERFDEDPQLYRRAAAAIFQLKKEDPKDWALWWALVEWLDDTHSEWMSHCAPIRCPTTGHELNIRSSVSGPQYVDPQRKQEGKARDRTPLVRDHVRELYDAAFEPLEELTVL